MTEATKTKAPSALDQLKALSGKKPAPAATALAVQVNDPAIAGAKPAKGSKSVVHLGEDPAIAESALTCARLRDALETAEAEFAVFQSELRDYGKKKRDLYNSTFKAGITTVCVPFYVEVPEDPASATPGRELRHIQVVCSNKYSVNAEAVRGNREKIGTAYEKLFAEETAKVLKPNAEELIRGILSEQGIEGEDLENAMNTLFETKVSVKTTAEYESVERELAPDLRSLLSQAVTRAEPGLKFPR